MLRFWKRNKADISDTEPAPEPEPEKPKRGIDKSMLDWATRGSRDWRPKTDAFGNEYANDPIYGFIPFENTIFNKYTKR